jgi:hypothetical protein
MGRFEVAAIENWEQSMYLSLFGNGQEKNCGQRRDEYRASQSSSAQHHKGSAEIQKKRGASCPTADRASHDVCACNVYA